MRCPFGATDNRNCSLECANDIEELIQTTTGGAIAAFMAEVVIGSGGFMVPPKGYFERAAQMGELPVLITSPSIRPHVRSIIERFRPQTVVMSQNEVHPRIRLKTVGSI